MNKDSVLWDEIKQEIQPLKRNQIRWERQFHSLPVSQENPPSYQLDLHGMTLQQAFEQTMHFIDSHFQRQTRHVQIICGKGTENSGVIKKELAFWLEQKNQQISSFTWQNDGGAVCVYLRRKK